MSERLVLFEHQPLEIALPDATIAFLHEHFPKRIKVLPGWRGRVTLRARSYIGTIVAPDLEIRIRPKCGTANVFAMLSWSYQLAHLQPELVQQERVDDVRDFLVAILAGHLEDLLRHGLRRGYVEQDDDLAVLRGRLRFGEHVRRPAGVRPLLPCRFEDYTADLPLNQVIRYTLHRIGNTGDSRLDRRLRRLRGALAPVTLRPFRALELATFGYDRLTRHYEPIHALCRLILDALGAEDEQGALPMGSFLVNMNLLFERFVAAWLHAHLPAPWTLVAQRGTHLDRAGQVVLEPDLVLHHHGRAALVADTKYKLARGTPDPHDLYQALAYCRALRIPQAVLLYPDLSAPSRPIVVRDGDNVLHADGIELHREWSVVEQQMAEMTRRLLALADRPGGPVTALYPSIRAN